jgi:DNA-binding ferritin-like protein (Dps family)
MKKNNSSLKDISWGDIQKYIDKDTYQNFFKQINPSIFKMALSEKNRPKVIQSILKVLKEKDPQNVSMDYAEKVADRMKELASMILKEK